MRWSGLPLALCAAVLAGCATTHPVTSSIGNFPDPFVLPDAGGYYAYATNGDGKNLPTLH